MTASSETAWPSALRRRITWFDRDPADYANSRSLAICLGGGIEPTLAARLQSSPRLRDRLSELLIDRLGWARCDAEFLAAESGWEPALLGGAELRRAARLAGASWHARSLRKVIRADALATLIAAIGEDAHRFAIESAAHAAADEAELPTEALPAAVETAGLGCLAAWLATRPEEVAVRVRLMLPPEIVLTPPSEDGRRARAAALFQLAAERLAAGRDAHA